MNPNVNIPNWSTWPALSAAITQIMDFAEEKWSFFVLKILKWWCTKTYMYFLMILSNLIAYVLNIFCTKFCVVFLPRTEVMTIYVRPGSVAQRSRTYWNWLKSIYLVTNDYGLGDGSFCWLVVIFDHFMWELNM